MAKEYAVVIGPMLKPHRERGGDGRNQSNWNSRSFGRDSTGENKAVKLILENWKTFLNENKKFWATSKVAVLYFRVELPGIGYAEGGEHLRTQRVPSRYRCLDANS